MILIIGAPWEKPYEALAAMIMADISRWELLKIGVPLKGPYGHMESTGAVWVLSFWTLFGLFREPPKLDLSAATPACFSMKPCVPPTKPSTLLPKFGGLDAEKHAVAYSFQRAGGSIRTVR